MSLCRRLLLFILLVPCIPLHEASAQDTIASDRPGFNNGSFVLGPGTLQLETGAALNAVGPEYSIGQVIIRAGIPGLELQAHLNSLVLRRSSVPDEGFQDPGVGVKLRLVNAPEKNYALSLLSTLSLPVGSSFLSSNRAIPSFSLLSDYGVNDRVSISNNVGYTIGRGGINDVLFLSAHPGFTLPAEANVGVYFGYAGFFSSGGDQHFLEGGITLFPTADIQLDINGGVELDTRDSFIGLGLATRWFLN